MCQLSYASSKVEVIKVAGSGVQGFQDGMALEAQFYQPSLVTCERNGDGIYVLDGVSIRHIANGRVETITSLWDCKDQLEPYGLDGEARIWSFHFGDLQWSGDNLYLSGLMFKKDVKGPLPNLSPQSYNWTREGFTYNVFFEIDPDKRSMKLLRADVAYCNIVPRTGVYPSGLWDSRPDLIPQSNGTALYAYYFFVCIPKIQPLSDGSFLVMKTEDKGIEMNGESHWIAKWYPDGHEEKLYNLTKMPGRYYEWNPVPNTKTSPGPGGNIEAVALPIDDNTIWLTDGENITILDLKTGERSNDWKIKNFMSGDALQVRGRKIGDRLYFLDHKGIWTVEKDGAATRIVDIRYLNYGGKVLGYDVDSQGNLVVGNYQFSTIDKFSLEEAQLAQEGFVYLNKKAVMSTEGNVGSYSMFGRIVPGEAQLDTDILKILNLTYERLYYPEDGNYRIYHPSGRNIKIPTASSGGLGIKLSDLIKAYNSISVLKLEGKWDGKNLYLYTTGTEDSHNDNGAPRTIYGLPAYD